MNDKITNFFRPIPKPNQAHNGNPINPNKTIFDNTNNYLNCTTQNNMNNTNNSANIVLNTNDQITDNPSFPLNILSINIHGLNDDKERENKFSWLKNLASIDLILFQETKCSSEKDAKKWQRQWFYPSIFSHSSQNRAIAGTAFLLTKTGKSKIRDFEIISLPTDHYGAISIIWGNTRWNIINFYAPSVAHDRDLFFKNCNILDEINNFQSCSKPDLFHFNILGGDFNCIENPSLDKIGGLSSGTFGFNSLKSIFAQLDLEDWWRKANPAPSKDNIVTTWDNKSKTKSIKVRLDRFYTPITGFSFIKNITHMQTPEFISDHKAISLCLHDPEQEIGPGYWKLNCSLLKDPSYIDIINEAIDRLILEKSRFDNLNNWWDNLKLTIKKISIKFASQKKKEEEKTKESLITLLSKLEKQANGQPDNAKIIHELLEAKSKFNTLEVKRVEGILLRSRAVALKNGAKATPALTSLEKITQKDNVILALKDTQGIAHKENPKILEIAKNFYSDLYNDTPDSVEIETQQNKILENLQTSLTDSEQLEISQPVTEIELTSTLKKMARNKSPGEDGLPAEFYQVFWAKLAFHFHELVTSIHSSKELSMSQKCGIISLIYKKGDKEDIKNYRPIALLNVDIKIITAVLTSRINKVAGNLIHPNQTAIKGRQITANIRLILDIIYSLENGKHPAFIILLDQEKAFDKLKWSFIFKVLKKLNFPEYIINWIRIIYQDPVSKLKINNFISQPFNLLRGVRQGDPLSPILFVLCIEVLASTIRNHADLKGFQIPKSTSIIKVLLYADDTSVILRSSKELKVLKEILSKYEIASGSKINRKKSEALAFNITPPSSDSLELKWIEPDTPIRFLGAYIGINLSNTGPWTDILTKFFSKIANWNQIPLPIKTKATVTNTYLLPLLYHQLSVMEISDNILREIEKSIRNFIWNGKKSRISHQLLFTPVEYGGMGIHKLELTIQVLRLKYLSKLVTNLNNPTPSDLFALFYIRNLAADWGAGLSILTTKFPFGKNIICPDFYKKIVSTSQKFLKINSINLSRSEILSQILFFNPLIKDQDNRLLREDRFKIWARCGVIRIRDLWNDGSWMSPADLNDVNGIRIPPKLLKRVIDAIPINWLQTLQNHHLIPYEVYGLPHPEGIQLFYIDGEGEISEQCIYHPGHNLDWSQCLPNITKKEVLREIVADPTVSFKDISEFLPDKLFLFSQPFLKLNTRAIKKSLQQPIIIPTTIKWNISIGKPVHWQNTFKYIWSTYTPLPWNQTFFNCIHQSFTLGSVTKYWKYNKTPLFCDCDAASVENHLHLFWSCSISQSLWALIWRIWHQRVGASPPKTLHSIFSLLIKPRFLSSLWIALIKCGLHSIWTHRCKHLYSQKDFSPSSLHNIFHHTFKTHLITIKNTHPKIFKTISQKTTLLAHPFFTL